MKNKLSFSGIVLILLSVAFSFSSCEDEGESLYEGYGLVSRPGGEHYDILLDNGTRLIPREAYINPAYLKDSTRLYMHFSLLEETDSCAYVRIIYADTILTKSVLPYEESILDSVGNDPVKITNAWFAHGFLNFEFLYAGRYHLNREHAHMVNLLQCENEGEELVFEFRHNDFDDYRDKIYMGVVSFPVTGILGDSGKPVKVKVKFNDSQNTTQTISLTYE